MRRRSVVGAVPVDGAWAGASAGVAHDDVWIVRWRDEGARVEGPAGARWLPLAGLRDVLVDPDSGWWALTHDDRGTATLWAVDPAAGVARGVAARRASLGTCSLAPGALVERRAGQSRVWRAGRARAPEPLPVGAQRGRVAPWAGGVVWVHDAHVYRRREGGPVRTAGTLPAPVAAVWAGPDGAWVAALADDRVAVAAPAARPVLVDEAVDGRPVFTADAVWLQAGDAVAVVALRTGAAQARYPGCRLAGGVRLLLDPNETLRPVGRPGP